MGWLKTAHDIFETLYFAAGIAIAVFACLGLKQIKLGLDQLKLTKEIAKTNARRESVKFAADQCRYFAETVMPSRLKMLEEYSRAGWTFLSTPRPPNQLPFVLHGGEIANNNF
jgi:hypothetical protein